jgi:hypothetical protein
MLRETVLTANDFARVYANVTISVAVGDQYDNGSRPKRVESGASYAQHSPRLISTASSLEFTLGA